MPEVRPAVRSPVLRMALLQHVSQQHVNQEDLHQFHYHQQLECQRSAPQYAACTQEAIVGTSTSCSSSCVARQTARIGTSSGKILGTSMTCTGT